MMDLFVKSRWALKDRRLWSLGGVALIVGSAFLALVTDSAGLALRHEGLPIPVSVVVGMLICLPVLGALHPDSTAVAPRSRGRRLWELMLWTALCGAIFHRAIDLGLPHLASPGVSAVIVTFIPIGITILTKHPTLGAAALLVMVFLVGMTPREVYPAPTWSLIASDQDAQLKIVASSFLMAAGVARYLR